jgi:hypothetical protein
VLSQSVFKVQGMSAAVRGIKRVRAEDAARDVMDVVVKGESSSAEQRRLSQ